MTSSPFTAVYDACVLYPAPLRDFLMRLALSGCFRARWSTHIHNEWKRNLLRNRPDLSAERSSSATMPYRSVSASNGGGIGGTDESGRA